MNPSPPYPPIQYHDYLKLDDILKAQSLRSEEFGNAAHDEMLFIITHQTYELWFKQILYEIDSVITIFSSDRVREENMGLAVSRLQRVIEIQKILIDQIRIMETMTPLDFLDFREYLYPASGFQSFQFRLVENKLGLESQRRLAYNQSSYRDYLQPHQAAQLAHAETEMSLFDGVEKWLERTPFLQIGSFNFWQSYREAVMKMFDDEKEVVSNNPNLGDEAREFNIKGIEDSRNLFESLFNSKSYEESLKQGQWRLSYKAIHAALFIQLYRHLPGLQLPFRLITSLLDIDELMTSWRSRHALMAKRMIGTKIGTGGSSGYQYLREATESHKIFTDFFQLTTFFIPKSSLPDLPEEIKMKLRFNYEQ
ncbi:MAG: tryptophan 2,3-dioxygenase [Bdellovibrionales bacterium]|nr:tryptophan 2,3-dioxygenase [Bdellovibrionales bacterium]